MAFFQFFFIKFAICEILWPGTSYFSPILSQKAAFFGKFRTFLYRKTHKNATFSLFLCTANGGPTFGTKARYLYIIIYTYSLYPTCPTHAPSSAESCLYIVYYTYTFFRCGFHLSRLTAAAVLSPLSRSCCPVYFLQNLSCPSPSALCTLPAYPIYV